MEGPYLPNRRCSCPRCLSWNLQGPAILITIGILFLLENFRIADWGRGWPLILIVIGALKFAQNGAPTNGHIQPAPRNANITVPQTSPPSGSAASQNPGSSSEVNRG